MTSRKILICIALMFYWPLYSQPYFTIGGGVVIPSETSSSKGNSNTVLYGPTVPGVSAFSLQNVTWKNEYKTGFELFALGGVSLNCHWRTDIEFLYQSLSRNVRGNFSWREIDTANLTIFAQANDNLIQHASNSAHLFYLMPNLYYDFTKCGHWNFFVGGGWGIAWLKSPRTTRNGFLIINLDNPPLMETAPTLEKSPSLGGTAFAWQVKIGTTYNIIYNCSLGLDYRLLGTTKFQARGSSIITNPNTPNEATFEMGQKNIRGFLNNSVNLFFTFKF